VPNILNILLPNRAGYSRVDPLTSWRIGTGTMRLERDCGGRERDGVILPLIFGIFNRPLGVMVRQPQRP